MPPISPAARNWILVSALFHLLLAPVAMIPGDGFTWRGGAAMSLWLLLLVLVWFRSRVARGISFVWTMTWAVLFTVGGIIDVLREPTTLLVAVVLYGQALPLLTPAVRDHVQKRDVAVPVPATA